MNTAVALRKNIANFKFFGTFQLLDSSIFSEGAREFWSPPATEAGEEAAAQDRAEAEALIHTMSHAAHLGFCEEVWKGLRRALIYVLVISRHRLHVSARTLHLVPAPEAACYCITVILPPGPGHGVLVLLLCANPSIRPSQRKHMYSSAPCCASVLPSLVSALRCTQTGGRNGLAPPSSFRLAWLTSSAPLLRTCSHHGPTADWSMAVRAI